MNTADRVLELLEDGHWETHKELARALGVTTYTVERAVKRLIETGKLRERPAYVPAGYPGRKPREFGIKPSAEHDK